MSSFKILQNQHQDLINKVQTGQESVDDIKKYIEDVKTSSSQIGGASERDQLRANLRYWASYVFERTQTYPNVDLAPAIIQQRPSWVIPIVIGTLVISIIGFVIILRLNKNPNVPNMTMTVGSIDNLTQSPAVPAETLTIETALPTMTVEPTQENIISIELTSVHDGDEVAPVTELSGTYYNLRAGYSIHVIIQPDREDNLQFPMPEYALIGSTASSGEWYITGKFGEGDELKQEQDYRIWVVFAVDENARQALLDAVDDGFVALPSGVATFVKPVSVHRAGFSKVLTGDRLIYSSFLEIEGNFEIYSASLDSEDRENKDRITYTSATSELFPSLSWDGKKIVYVARRRDENNSPLYSVEIINSDGTFPETIREAEDGFIYENPLYSINDRYIAYAVGKTSGEASTIWSIAIYDVKKHQTTSLVNLIGEGTSGPRYISWVPDTYELVYNARYGGSGGFRMINVETPNVTSDTDGEFFNELGEQLQPSLSPDGSKLAYMQLDNSIGNIYVADLATGKIQQLTQNQFTGSHPTWSPDGKTIYYQYFADGFFSIWSVTIGEEPIPITFGLDQYPFIGNIEALIP